MKRKKTARRSRGVEGVDTDDGAAIAADAAPRQGNAGFDDDGRHAFGQDGGTVGGILLLVEIKTGHGDDLHTQAFFAQFGSSGNDERDFGMNKRYAKISDNELNAR